MIKMDSETKRFFTKIIRAMAKADNDKTGDVS